MQLTKVVSFMEEIAKHVGDTIIMKGYNSDNTKVEYKSRTNIVTNIDKESEEYLFTRIHEEFPDHNIVAEEGSEKKTEGNYIWYVDPLDGTNNFAHSIPHFSVSLGLYSKEEQSCVAACVYEPVRQECFTAESGKGAFLNGEPISVSAIDDLGYSIIATGFPYNKTDERINNKKQFNAVLHRVQGIRRFGSAALDLCYVACGRVDGYWEATLFPWDMAGGMLIAKEAGAVVSNYSNEKCEITEGELIAANPKVHVQLQKIIGENTSFFPRNL